ncbi:MULTISPECIES: tetratricopeptide repeat protein [Burkholderia cepacia complex]|uniref:tetratricopeptide repeat protein n=1 Tax=Burkholderia cepacia complex TaxID=87882 RepID=UPI001B9CF379|nr:MULTISPECIES: tetratricopeptide repeat protein [Burkholderia cepacia complex]MBR8206467.1 hypothetical protein [Burkholderia vietnamiensis]MCA8395255.1 hypothetical protein [Burkholderia vietnamiensis]MDN8076367.1 tetratricopeptide repeat protein [Burkholderia vietnamiensis]MEB2604773.1 tetratricopeptide repeat protein [Burkholderia cenocepacia]HDR8958770.1 hypothetical protein [Burkholderia vietnamiensis]
MEDLNPIVRDEIDKKFIRAREKFKAGDGVGAVQDAEAAWSELPVPKFGWDVSKSYTQALAKIYRDTGNYQNALNLMQELFASGTVKPHQDGPRFVIGTIYFEKGDAVEAKKWFGEANQISKGRCFQGEDKKYLDFFKSK